MTYSLCSNSMEKGVQTYSSIMDTGSSARSALCPPSTYEAKSFWDAALARSPPWSPTDDKEPPGISVAEQETIFEVEPSVAGDISHEQSSTSPDVSDDDGNPNPWITIQPWCSRSLEKFSPKLRLNKNVDWTRHYKVNQSSVIDPIIDAVVESLTPDQCKHINRWSHAMKSKEDITDSRKEGPSQPKGKGTDPLNWGNVDIDPTESSEEGIWVHQVSKEQNAC